MLSGFENPFHIVIVAVVVLLLFGAKRMPEMGRSLGTGMREFRDGILGRESSAPGQGALESAARPVESSRHGSPVG
ncbi:MAG TPA: twin-arginine translocase TatA/TatE family subunit [Solirubrobacteraceae bacterium]|nr:twin-arginine translocase TatA/TatE family subunit [Solirubrobacteraceae bacterium]